MTCHHYRSLQHADAEDLTKGGKKRKAEDEGGAPADGDDSGLPKKKKTKKELAKAASKSGRVKGIPIYVYPIDASRLHSLRRTRQRGQTVRCH